MSTIALKPLGEIADIGAGKLPAALLTTMSSPPRRSTAPWTTPRTASASRTSHTPKEASTPSPDSSATAASSTSCLPAGQHHLRPVGAEHPGRSPCRSRYRHRSPAPPVRPGRQGRSSSAPPARSTRPRSPPFRPGERTGRPTRRSTARPARSGNCNGTFPGMRVYNGGTGRSGGGCGWVRRRHGPGRSTRRGDAPERSSAPVWRGGRAGLSSWRRSGASTGTGPRGCRCGGRCRR